MRRTTRRAARLALLPALAGAMVAGAVLPAAASSHREAPLISEDPVADNTDVYAFVSPDRPDTVTVLANFIPLEEPASGPNFWKFGDDVLYRINIDNDGDAVADITYDFRFQSTVRHPDTYLYNTGPVTSPSDPDWNMPQTYSVMRTEHGVSRTVASGRYTPPVNVGPVSTPGYPHIAAQAVYSLPGGGKVFAGQRDDPFFVDLGAIFDLAQLRPFAPAYKPRPGKATKGIDAVAGYNAHTIGLQLPNTDLTRDHKAVTSASSRNAIVGVWSTTYRRQTRVLSAAGKPSAERGPWVEVSRLGMPLVNEVVIPLEDKDVWNASEPKNDAQFGKYVLNPFPAAAIHALYGVPVPPAPRNDLAAIFLTGISGLNMPAGVKPSEELRLNMGIAPTRNPKPLGVLAGDLAGFPNGRRLGDDVTDIELRALAGGTPLTPSFNKSPNNDLGDGANANDRPFLGSFPYAATPWWGYGDLHGKTAGFPPPLKP